MEDILRAIILGIVQGLTEFLPISSSGHLILVPALFNWPDQGLAFDVGLHLGTLLALLAYFWRDWLGMARSLLADLREHGRDVRSYREPSRLALLIALGTIPIAVVGLAAGDAIEEHTREPWFVAITLAAVGVVLIVAERFGRRTRPLAGLTVLDAVVIGLAQACAAFPGVSRSGATMSAALFRNLERDAAARYAFLLGTPAIAGAGILLSRDLFTADSAEVERLIAGFAASAVVGFVAIHWLMRFVRTHSLAVFGGYRIAVAALTLLIAAFRVT